MYLVERMDVAQFGVALLQPAIQNHCGQEITDAIFDTFEHGRKLYEHIHARSFLNMHPAYHAMQIARQQEFILRECGAYEEHLKEPSHLDIIRLVSTGLTSNQIFDRQLAKYCSHGWKPDHERPLSGEGYIYLYRHSLERHNYGEEEEAAYFWLHSEGQLSVTHFTVPINPSLLKGWIHQRELIKGKY